jgi:hypothetical protein
LPKIQHHANILKATFFFLERDNRISYYPILDESHFTGIYECDGKMMAEVSYRSIDKSPVRSKNKWVEYRL